MITINQIKKLPKYIMVLNTEMRLVNNQISHKEDRIYELDELCDIPDNYSINDCKTKAHKL